MAKSRSGAPESSGLPLMGFSKIVPPPMSVPVVLSRSFFRRGCCFGVSSLFLTRGPPLSFLTTSTVYSDWLLAGLLHPATGHGIQHVSGLLALALRRPVLPRDSALQGLTRLSRDALPCEAFPSSPALHCVTTADTFSSLPSVSAVYRSVLPRSSGRLLRVGATSRSCSDAESVAVLGVAT